MCLVNCYLPSGNDSEAVFNFSNDIDALNELIVKFGPTHHLIICGDLNADHCNRNGTKEKRLMNLIQEHNLLDPGDNTSTYINLHLSHSSRIDHFFFKFTFELDPPVDLSILDTPDLSNTSSHLPLVANLKLPGFSKLKLKKKATMPLTKKIFDYSAADQNLFTEVLNEELSGYNLNLLDIDDALQVLQSSLNTASVAAIPYRTKKLSSTKRRRPRWTPELAAAVKGSKSANRIWKDAGSPRGDHPLWQRKKKATKRVRAVQRQEEASNRAKLRNEISLASTSDQALFHKLVRRQRLGQPSSSSLLVDGRLITEDSAIRKEFASAAEKLGTPDCPDTNVSECIQDSMREISRLSTDCLTISTSDVCKMIKELKNNKAADRDGYKAEHLKLLLQSPAALTTLTDILNGIFSTSRLPASAKIAFKTPVHKRGKDPRYTDNYRGITVTSIFGKLVEHLVRHYGQDDINHNQSGLQYDLTRNLNPNMASVIITESIVEAKENKQELYICSLDARKAFDIVPHSTLKFKLFNTPIRRSLWKLLDDLYTDNVETIRWKGEDSEQYIIRQGVRQGGVTSTDLYKLFTNDRLLSLERSGMGLYIGSTFIGATAVADDQLLISTCKHELQGMMSICNDYAVDHKEILHPTKSVVVEHQLHPSNSGRKYNWCLGDDNVTIASKFEHLGLQWESKSNTPSIEDRIKSGRRTAYALMGVGLYGTNGLDPGSSLSLIRAYITPRLTSGLNASVLTKTQISHLSQYHRMLLRQVQGLPKNSTTTAIYLLSGTLPLEAALDLGKLSLFGAIARLSPENNLYEVAVRQLALKKDSSKSWFANINLLGDKYGLDIHSGLHCPWPKLAWKSHVRLLVQEFWQRSLIEEATDRSTLKWLIIHDSWLGRLHPLWSCCRGKPYQTKAATIRATLLIGRYGLQEEKVKFTKQETNPVCPLCHVESEDVVHFITRCPKRQPSIQDMIKDLQKLYHEEDLRAPASNDEITSAVLNGWGYRREALVKLGGDSGSGVSSSILSLAISSSSLVVALSNKTIPANQLCNSICLRLHINRDNIWNSILMESNTPTKVVTRL